jgi:hypothetical protein
MLHPWKRRVDVALSAVSASASAKNSALSARIQPRDDGALLEELLVELEEKEWTGQAAMEQRFPKPCVATPLRAWCGQHEVVA